MTEQDILTSSGKYKYREKLASTEVRANCAELARRITQLLTSFSHFSGDSDERKLSSGFRDKDSNTAAGGAKFSSHLEGRAADIRDEDGRLALFCVRNLDLLEHFQLWMEDPHYTKGWVHLQSRPVPLHRIFKPF